MSILLWSAAFLYYLLTLGGCVAPYRDSGDMLNAVYTLGIAHPPGYPLYILLARLFLDLLPFGTPAYRLNIFSAACTASAVVLLYRVGHMKLSRDNVPDFTTRSAALAACILFAVTPAVQALSRVSEMYALAGLFAVAIIACVQTNARGIRLGCFLLGLGFGIHPTLLFLFPLLITFEPREAGRRLLFFALGFSVILFLLVRSHTDPVQNWGNPSTWGSLWHLITRSNYGGLKLHPVESQFSWTPAGVFAQLGHFLGLLFKQWGWVGVAAGMVGACVSFKRDLRVFIAWLIAGPAFFLLSNLPLQERTTDAILEPYFILINVIWALWLISGIAILIKRVPSAYGQIAALGILVGAAFFQQNAFAQSSRGNWFAYDLGRNYLRTLPKDAVLYDPDDPIAFTLRSLQLQEKRGTDIALLNFFRTRWGYQQIARRWPDLLPPVPITSAQELDHVFWTYSVTKRPFFVDLPLKLPSGSGYGIQGLVYPVVPRPAPPLRSDLAKAENSFSFYTWRGDWRTSDHPDFFIQQILNYRAAAHCNLGLKYAEIAAWDSARRQYRLALTIDPYLSAAYNNLGSAAYNQGHFAEAIKEYQLALRYAPQNSGYRRNLELAQQAVGH